MKIKKTVLGLAGISAMAIPIVAVVSCGDDEMKKSEKKMVTTTDLVSGSFEFTGAQGSGSIAFKNNKTLPEQVEVKYYKGSDESPADNQYAASLSNLSNDEKVKIKFFIKTANADTHQFPTGFTNPIEVTVTGLLIAVTTTDLVSSSFEFTGNQGSGSIAFKNNKTLPEQVKVKYYKGSDESPADNQYVASLSNLSNDEKVKIKFFIKTANADTHQFPTGFTNPIELTVTGLSN